MNQDVRYGTHVVSGGGQGRLESALVTPWPPAFDFEADIFLPGKASAFATKLASAVSTRRLAAPITERAPELADVRAENPDAAEQDCLDALRAVLNLRQAAATALAAALPSCIKMSALSHADADVINTLSANGDGVAIYAWIIHHLDLRAGRVQDRLRVKFAQLTVKPTDSAVSIVASIDLKWWLYKHHTVGAAAEGRDTCRV